jgi:hypothetical protein
VSNASAAIPITVISRRVNIRHSPNAQREIFDGSCAGAQQKFFQRVYSH